MSKQEVSYSIYAEGPSKSRLKKRLGIREKKRIIEMSTGAGTNYSPGSDEPMPKGSFAYLDQSSDEIVFEFRNEQRAQGIELPQGYRLSEKPVVYAPGRGIAPVENRSEFRTAGSMRVIFPGKAEVVVFERQER